MSDLEDLANSGFRIFPLNKKKRPLTPNGFKDAKSGEEGIALVERAKTDYVGIATGQYGDTFFFVVDCDVYKPGGEEDFNSIANLLTKTYTVATQSGGMHYYYYSKQHVGSPSLADTIEVKGVGGYVAAPPSPGYTVVDDVDIAEAPDALIRVIDERRNAYGAKSKSALILDIYAGRDLHNNLRSYSKRLAEEGKTPDAISGALVEALSVAARNPSIPEDRQKRITSLLTNDQGELSRLIDSADAKFNPKTGAEGMRSILAAAGSHLFSPVEQEQEPNSQEEGVEHDLWYVATNAEDAEVKPLLVEPWIHVGDVVVLSAKPKAGKTTFALDLALSIGAGIPVADSFLRPLNETGGLGRHTVVYYALEGQEAVKTRVKAWLNAKGLGVDDTVSTVIAPVAVNLTTQEGRKKVIDELKRRDLTFQHDFGWGPIALIVFDTLTKVMPGKDQNTVEDTSEVFRIVDELLEAFGGRPIAVMFVHHDDKAGKGPRGSSNITAEPDLVLRLAALDPSAFPESAHVTAGLAVRVDMARSIDIGDPINFAVDSKPAGVTSQGIERTAPVLRCINHIPMSTHKPEAKAPLSNVEKPRNALGSAERAEDMMVAARVLELVERLIETSGGQASFKEVDAMLLNDSEIEVRRFYIQNCKIKKTVPLIARMKQLRTSLVRNSGSKRQPFGINAALSVIVA